jgi:ribosomal protein S18 acetylase RimI-like enzyme
MLTPARDDDVPQIVALMNRAYRGIGARQGWNTEAGYISGNRTTADLLRAEMSAKPDASLLMWRDGEGDVPKGCVWLEPLGGDAWYLGSLTIDPERQNEGLGHALLALAEQWIAARGGKRVRMTVVNIREALIAWYGRRDYRPTGEINPFPYGDDRFGIPLRDDLSFVVLEKNLPVAARD